MNNALDIFVDAANTAHNLDIPSRVMAEKLVRSAMRIVALDLANNNINGAIETKNKYESLEHWFRRQHADLITQNTVAVGRLRLIRQIGNYIKNNYEHELGGDKKSLSPNDNDRLKDLPIASSTYLKWMDASDIDEEVFSDWAEYYTSEDVNENDEIYLSRFLSFFYPDKYSNDIDIPNLLPHMKLVYIRARDLMDACNSMLDEISKGETPPEQVNKVFEQLDRVSSKIADIKKMIGDLYWRGNNGN